jgi:tetratricopeptide (TPR) repeat protein
MPKRRTGDVVHAVMTDHFIQRHKSARDLLAPLTETHETEETAYKGEVVPLYPLSINPLYLAVAQVAEGTNLRAGLLRLQAAIDTHRPREAEFYFYLADAYRQTGQDDRARLYYEETLRRKPGLLAARHNYAALLNMQAEAYLGSGKTEQAVAALQRAVTLNPESAAAHFNHGRALAARGLLDQGQAEFEAALKLDPDSAEAATSLGILLAMKGQFDRAIPHYRHAIQAQPQLLLARLHLALALLSRGDRPEAKQLLQSVIQSDPNDRHAQLELGRIYLAEGNHAAAAVCFRKASEQ